VKASRRGQKSLTTQGFTGSESSPFLTAARACYLDGDLGVREAQNNFLYCANKRYFQAERKYENTVIIDTIQSRIRLKSIALQQEP